MHDGIDVDVTVDATFCAPDGDAVRVLTREVTRGVSRVTNPDRDDAGILRFSVEAAEASPLSATRDSGTLTLRVRVRLPEGCAPDEAAWWTMDRMRHGLDLVTDYMRRDEGLVSFALAETPERTADHSPGGF